MAARSRSEIAVLGDRESILGFRALGASVMTTESLEEEGEKGLRERLRQIVRREVKILFITEDALDRFGKVVEELRGDQLFPVLGIVPSIRGSRGLAYQRMNSMVERAIGANIFAQSTAGEKERSER